MQTKISGTKEWAFKNINTFTGKCLNGCIYCYAISNIVRYKQNPDFVVKRKVLTQQFKKREFITMYPSAHDIRPENINEHVTFLKNFLKSGSELLIVTKPSLRAMENLCYFLQEFKNQIEFRFTIGSVDSTVLDFYEPNAPGISERISSVILAHSCGYATSLSIEPMLDEHPERVIERLHGVITGNIWIGKLNNPIQRVKMNGHAHKIPQVKLLADWQANDENILNIVNRLSQYPNIKWKDSIKQVIERSKQ